MSWIICRGEWVVAVFDVEDLSRHKITPSILTRTQNDTSALTTFRKETENGQEMELHQFEVAALMNLVATDTMVEEAVALIPSLSR